MTTSLLSRLKFEQDLDRFEERLENFIQSANPDQLVQLVARATVYLENAAEQASSGPSAQNLRYEGWTYFNNATSAINHAARALRQRI